jgi:hypothetical protein
MAMAFAMLLTACGESREPIPPPQTPEGRGEKFTFGEVSTVEGTPFVTIPLLDGRRETSYDNEGAERNRLILDTRSGASRRVLPDNQAPIDRWVQPTETSAVPGAPYRHERPQSGLKRHYAAVVRREHGKDKPSNFDILLGRFADGRQVWAAQNVRGVGAIWLTGEGRIAMIVETDARTVFRLYDADSLKMVLEREL